MLAVERVVLKPEPPILGLGTGEVTLGWSAPSVDTGVSNMVGVSFNFAGAAVLSDPSTSV